MSTLQKLNPNCAGIDIGSESIFIGIENCDVASFGTFTDDYLKAIAYLKQHNITAVAMEATGVYWITLFDMIEAAGITVTLVNGKQVKYLPVAPKAPRCCRLPMVTTTTFFRTFATLFHSR